MTNMGLLDFFRPIWMTTHWKNEGKAVGAVDKITDPVKLAKIAQTAPMDNVRQWAVGKLADQSVLLRIAKKDGNSSIRRDAVAKLADPSALADFAKNDNDMWVREAAVRNENLADPSVLAHVAGHDKEDFVRKAAEERMASIEVFKSGDAETFLKIMADCTDAYKWDEGYKAFTRLQALAGQKDVRVANAMYKMLWNMFGYGETSDRFADHVNRHMPGLISVEFVKENLGDGGVLGNLRHLIPDSMIVKACGELGMSEEQKQSTYAVFGVRPRKKN